MWRCERESKCGREPHPYTAHRRERDLMNRQSRTTRRSTCAECAAHAPGSRMRKGTCQSGRRSRARSYEEGANHSSRSCGAARFVLGPTYFVSVGGSPTRMTRSCRGPELSSGRDPASALVGTHRVSSLAAISFFFFTHAGILLTRLLYATGRTGSTSSPGGEYRTISLRQLHYQGLPPISAHGLSGTSSTF